MFVRTLFAVFAVFLLSGCMQHNVNTWEPDIKVLPKGLQALTKVGPKVCNGQVHSLISDTGSVQHANFLRNNRNGKELIVVSKSIDESTMRDFVIEHECAHYLVGKYKHKLNPHQEEFAADCYATIKMIKAGNIKAINGFMIWILTNSLHSTRTHPSGEARVANINKCAAKFGYTL